VGSPEPSGPRLVELDGVIAVAEFRAALRRFLRQSELVAKACGLTSQRYLLLLMIKGAADRSEQTTVTELTERLQLAQNTVTDLVRRSEQAGLISRDSSPRDARVTYLRLTAHGEHSLARVLAGLAEDRRALREAIDSLDS